MTDVINDKYLWKVLPSISGLYLHTIQGVKIQSTVEILPWRWLVICGNSLRYFCIICIVPNYRKVTMSRRISEKFRELTLFAITILTSFVALLALQSLKGKSHSVCVYVVFTKNLAETYTTRSKAKVNLISL